MAVKYVFLFLVPPINLFPPAAGVAMVLPAEDQSLASMDNHLKDLPLEDLEQLYRKAEQELQQALITGVPWKEIKPQRALVTRLSIIIHKRKYPLTSEDPPEQAREKPNKENP